MEPNIAILASLIGDQARARMLTALMGGQALTATELALEADITAQTASSHLNKLVSGELLVVRKQGRHKYFQLKDAQVAELLEQLLTVTAAIPRLREQPIHALDVHACVTTIWLANSASACSMPWSRTNGWLSQVITPT